MTNGLKWRMAAHLALGVIVMTTMGCSERMITSRIEKQIEQRLPALIGPAKSYDVQVKGSVGNLMKGGIEEIVVRGESVQASHDLTLDNLMVNMRNVKVNTRTHEIKSIGGTAFEAVVREKTLNDYLVEARDDKPVAQLQTGKMIVRVTPTILGIGAVVAVTGHLAPVGSKILFKVDKVEVASIPTPKMAAKMVENRVNPVIDLAPMGFSPEIKSIDIIAGAVKVYGNIHITPESLTQSASL